MHTRLVSFKPEWLDSKYVHLPEDLDINSERETSGGILEQIYESLNSEEINLK